MDVSLHVRRAPAGGWLSIAATVLRRGRAVASAAPAQLIGATLRSAIARLSLLGSLAEGRYTLRVRLLEATPHGVVAGSVLVSQSVGVRVG